MGMTNYRAVRVLAITGAGVLALAMTKQTCTAQAIPPKTTKTTLKDPAATGPAKATTDGPLTVKTGSALKADAPTPDPKDTIDRVVAIVNGDLILESDVDEERRFTAFQPFTNAAGTYSRETAIERLINRTLILQQAKLQPAQEIKATDVSQQIATLRKEIPECKQERCETEEGWNTFLSKQGFTAPELQERWKQRMEVLQYIENRFRMGIRISPEEIRDYYQKTMLPAYVKRKATPPKLNDISERIQEILLQQRVSKLLQDWLQSLKAQGTLQVMKPGEVAP